MFHVVRFITICCTALMLLVQPVYANSAVNAAADSIAAAPMIRVAQAHPQLLVVAALVNNFTQVAYCVWLT